MRIFFVILISLGLIRLTSLNAQEIERFLPSAEQIRGWKLQKGPEVYEGDELFDLIDGGADIYFEYGFTRVVSAGYFDADNNISQVEIYEMVDPPAAYGIFSITHQTVEWNTNYGQLCVSTDDYTAFWKGRYYVSISWISRQNPGARPIDILAESINAGIPDQGAYPGLLNGFSMQSPDLRAVYIQGNLGLSNFYYFDYRDIFEIRQAVAWTFPDHHRIILDYPDIETAQKVVSSSRQSMMGNKRFTDVAMIYQGYTCRDNKGNLILVRQEERYIVLLVALKPGTSLPPVLDEVVHQIEAQQHP